MAEPVDLFRRALAGAARAISKDSEVEVVFASEVARNAEIRLLRLQEAERALYGLLDNPGNTARKL